MSSAPTGPQTGAMPPEQPQYQHPPAQQFAGQPQGAPPQAYGQPQDPGLHQRAAHAAEVVGRHISTPETKEFFKTSEFAVWLVTVLAVLIAGLVSENLFSNLAWTLVVVLSAAYILSRGISKAATRRGDENRHNGSYSG